MPKGAGGGSQKRGLKRGRGAPSGGPDPIASDSGGPVTHLQRPLMLQLPPPLPSSHLGGAAPAVATGPGSRDRELTGKCDLVDNTQVPLDAVVPPPSVTAASTNAATVATGAVPFSCGTLECMGLSKSRTSAGCPMAGRPKVTGTAAAQPQAETQARVTGPASSRPRGASACGASPPGPSGAAAWSAGVDRDPQQHCQWHQPGCKLEGVALVQPEAEQALAQASPSDPCAASTPVARPARRQPSSATDLDGPASASGAPDAVCTVPVVRPVVPGDCMLEGGPQAFAGAPSASGVPVVGAFSTGGPAPEVFLDSPPMKRAKRSMAATGGRAPSGATPGPAPAPDSLRLPGDRVSHEGHSGAGGLTTGAWVPPQGRASAPVAPTGTRSTARGGGGGGTPGPAPTAAPHAGPAAAAPVPPSPFTSLVPLRRARAQPPPKPTPQELPEAVAGKAVAFLAQLMAPVVAAGGGPPAIAAAVKARVSALGSHRLFSEAKEEEVAAEVVRLLNATGAKAKPAIRVLFARVGQAGRMHGGYSTAASMFAELGFAHLASLQQNMVRACLQVRPSGSGCVAAQGRTWVCGLWGT